MLAEFVALIVASLQVCFGKEAVYYVSQGTGTSKPAGLYALTEVSLLAKGKLTQNGTEPKTSHNETLKFIWEKIWPGQEFPYHRKVTVTNEASNKMFELIGASYDRHSGDALLRLGTTHMSLIRTSLCKSNATKETILFKKKVVSGPAYAANHTTVDLSGWKSGVASIALHRLEVYFLLAGKFDRKAEGGAHEYRIELRRGKIEACRQQEGDGRKPGGKFYIFNCTNVFATIYREQFASDEGKEPRFRPLKESALRVQEFEGRAEVYFQLLESTYERGDTNRIKGPSKVEIVLYRVVKGAKPVELNRNRIRKKYGEKLVVQQVGLDVYKGIICWSEISRVRCMFRSDEKRVYTLLKDGEAAKLGVCRGLCNDKRNKDCDRGSAITGVAISGEASTAGATRKNEKVRVWFGCFAQEISKGGAGEIRFHVRGGKASQRKIYALQHHNGQPVLAGQMLRAKCPAMPTGKSKKDTGGDPKEVKNRAFTVCENSSWTLSLAIVIATLLSIYQLLNELP